MMKYWKGVKQYIRFLVLFSKWSTLFKIKICSGEHILHTTISCQILYSTTPSLNQSNNDNNINNNNNPCVRTLEGECFQNHPFLNVKKRRPIIVWIVFFKQKFINFPFYILLIYWWWWLFLMYLFTNLACNTKFNVAKLQ